MNFHPDVFSLYSQPLSCFEIDVKLNYNWLPLGTLRTQAVLTWHPDEELLSRQHIPQELNDFIRSILVCVFPNLNSKSSILEICELAIAIKTMFDKACWTKRFPDE